MENILITLPTGSLLQQVNDEAKYKFFIPSYQRGYRWESDQVVELLDDLFEFITNSETTKEKYCLQPIVVKELSDGRYEILDGQQRLTTIYILLTRLKKDLPFIKTFNLDYETRPNSRTFLDNISEGINDENPDFYYISSAYSTIDAWLIKAFNHSPAIFTSLYTTLVSTVEFIWYQIENEVDAIDVFTRINIGKIPLTNAELVKAVFLSKNNLSLGYASADIATKDYNRLLSLKQNAIALEWDQIEKQLQDPKVWGFIYGGNLSYQTRIDYLLDLGSHKKDTDRNKYFSFKYFYEKVKIARGDKALLVAMAQENNSVIEKEWRSLKEVFEILMEWFSDKSYNHLIGFLINQKVPIVDLVDEFKEKSRGEFLTGIKSRISKLISCNDISKLEYGKHNAKIEQLLLFHNVVNSLNVIDDNNHFPFEKLAKKLWTLEHIFAQNSDELREDDFLSWIDDHLKYFQSYTDNPKTAEIVTLLGALKKTEKRIERDKFDEAFKLVANYIQEEMQLIESNENSEMKDLVPGSNKEDDKYNWVVESNSIANLALLDGSINSALKNSLFDIKRSKILDKDREGQFVPNETKKVFLKYYTSSPKHLAYWTFEDRKAYVESIKATLQFLN